MTRTWTNITQSCDMVSVRLWLPVSLRYLISPPLVTNVLSTIERFTSAVFPGINITLSWTRGEVVLLGVLTVKVNMLYRGSAVYMWSTNTGRFTADNTATFISDNADFLLLLMLKYFLQLQFNMKRQL